MSAQQTPAPVQTGLSSTLRALVLSSGVYFAADVFARSFALFLLPLYTRYLSPAEYGVIAIVSTVTLILVIVLGLQMPLVRLHFEYEDEDERRALYGTILIGTATIGVIGALVIEALGRQGMLDFFEGVPYDPWLRYAVGMAYAGLFFQLATSMYVVQQRPRMVGLLTILNAVTLAAFTVAFVVILRQGALGAVRASFLAAVVMGVLAVILFARRSAPRVSWPMLATALALGVPLVAHSVSSWLLYVSDRIVLAEFVSQSQVGIYFLAASIASIGTMVADALLRAFTPVMYSGLKTKEGTAQAARLGTWWVAALAWAATALALLGDDVVRILTPARFHEAAGLVVWLAFGALALGLYHVASQGAWFAMKTRSIPIFTAIAGGANVGLNILLVPHFGIVAAAWNTLAGFLILAVLQGWYANRLYPVLWEFRRWIKLLIAAAVIVTLGVPVAATTSPLVIVYQLGLLVFGFPLIVTMLRTLSPAEWRQGRALLRKVVRLPA